MNLNFFISEAKPQRDNEPRQMNMPLMLAD